MAVTGAKAVSAALRASAAAVRREVGEELERLAANVVLPDMRALAPRDSGAMAAALTWERKDEDATHLRVLIGLPTLRLANDFFYARFVEYGTKGYQAGATRKRQGSKTTSKIRKSVPARPAQPFMGPSIDLNITPIEAGVRAAIERAIGMSLK